jgi:hypothetical protein
MNLLLFVVFSVLISKDSGDRLLILLQIFIFAGLVIALDALFAFYSGKSLLWGTQSAPCRVVICLGDRKRKLHDGSDGDVAPSSGIPGCYE